MTILVTGAAGYIGSHIVHALDRFHDQPRVIGVDLLLDKPADLPHDFRCYMGNVSHREFMFNLIKREKVTEIIHCAASTSVPESVAQPMAYYSNNVAATLDLVTVAVATKVKAFVFSSSAAVYGEGPYGVPRIKEDDPTRPMSPYGESKLVCEAMLNNIHAAHGINIVNLRYFNVAGADPLAVVGPRGAAKHLIRRAAEAALGVGPKLVVAGDGTDVRDYVHVCDVADANIRALEWCSRKGGRLTLNVGTGSATSVAGVLDVFNSQGLPVPLVTARRREGDPKRIVADTARINEHFNWTPQYGIADIVEHTIRWERKK